MATDWRKGQYEAVGQGWPSARGRLASICAYGNIYENACDIVDALLAPENRDLLLAAVVEADGGCPVWEVWVDYRDGFGYQKVSEYATHQAAVDVAKAMPSGRGIQIRPRPGGNHGQA